MSNYLIHTCVLSSGTREEENHREDLQSVLQTDEELLEGLVLLFSPAKRRDAAFLEFHLSRSELFRLFESVKNEVVLLCSDDLEQEHPLC